MKISIDSITVRIDLRHLVPVAWYSEDVAPWYPVERAARVMVQPTYAEVTWFPPGEGIGTELPQIELYGRPLTVDGARDRRYGSAQQIIGHDQMRADLIELTRRQLVTAANLIPQETTV